MYRKVNSLGLYGLNAFAVDVEVEISKAIPSFDIIGMGDIVVRESRDRIKAALRSCAIMFPEGKVTVNLAPADTKKCGSMHDLAMFVAIASLAGGVGGDFEHTAFIGELALNGDVRAVNGVLPMVLLALSEGFTTVFVPYDNAFEASVVEGISVYGVKNVSQLVDFFNDVMSADPLIRQPLYNAPESDFYDDTLDFADVMGQSAAKKALEYAAAGGHNVLLIGSPGSGKSMLAKRVPSIMPAMTFEESIETTNIHSVAGILDKDTPLVTIRPFRSPHHTISTAGLAGGGSIPRPGEISLAHNGLLFLDELPEFARPTLEILRQPLEDRTVTISRAAGTISYPCSFMLVAAMNPCPCGYYGHPHRECRCGKKQVSAYLSRISGPLLDRFDIHCEVSPVEYEQISSKVKAEASAVIRQRVQKAREIQQKRFAGTSITCNARIPSSMLKEVCPTSVEADEMFRAVFDKMGLSARTHDRILKVSRTIADMDGSEVIEKAHIAKAVRYRSLDRKYWG